MNHTSPESDASLRLDAFIDRFLTEAATRPHAYEKLLCDRIRAARYLYEVRGMTLSQLRRFEREVLNELEPFLKKTNENQP